MERSNAWKKYTPEEKQKVFSFAEDYRQFISDCKTERTCVDRISAEAKAAGFIRLEDVIASGKRLMPGDRVYTDRMGKSLVLFVIGKRPLEKGLRILGAHIDSPRLDIKQNPLYEDTQMVLLDTHYYGGIKKYQWVALPLALHGVVAKKDGSVVKVAIGDRADDPVLGVSDLLIHLAADQMEKKLAKGVEGEKLDVLIGSMPATDPAGPGQTAQTDAAAFEEASAKNPKEAKDSVRENILRILKEQYGIEEEDFLSAELEVVPAGPARDYGLDRSMIMGYGHDDRVCAYPSFTAIRDVQTPEYTSACLLVDKEEIGSVGATGMQSRFFENTVAELCAAAGDYSELTVRRCLMRSKALSSDVSAAYDPNYPEVMEKKNAAYFGRGVVFNKYTGSRGKSGSNDASAEYMAKIRRIMDDAGVNFQTAELGKVDQGGGGTIAYILGNYGMRVIDSGVAVLNMHAPWEIISKADLYEAKCCYEAFLADTAE